MAVSYVTQANSNTSSTTVTSQTITIPAAVQAGDVLLLVANCYSGASGSTTINIASTGSAWTRQGSSTYVAGTSAQNNGSLFYLKAAAADAGKVITISTGVSLFYNITLVAYRGASVTFDGAAVTSSATLTASDTCPTITTAQAGTWLVTLGSLCNGSAGFSSCTGPSLAATVREANFGSNSGIAIASDSNGPVSAGSQVPGHFTPSSTADYITWTIGLAPSGASVTAGLAAGTGTAWSAPMTIAVAGRAAGTGTALPPNFGYGTAGVATGTGTAKQAAIGGTLSPGLELSGFGSFSSVPSGARVNSVTVAVAEHQSVTGHASLFELWDYSNTPAQIGTTQTGTASTGTLNVSSAVFTGVTYTMLATLRVRVYGTLPSGGTESVDGVTLTVNYTPLPAQVTQRPRPLPPRRITYVHPQVISGPVTSQPGTGNAGLPQGTGTAQPAPLANANAGLANGTAGAVLAVTLAAAVAAGLAAGTAASALPPATSHAVAPAAGLAAGTGTVPGPVLAAITGFTSAPGAAVPGLFTPGATTAGTFSLVSSLPAVGVTAGQVTGTGTAFAVAVLPDTVVTAGLASGTGTARAMPMTIAAAAVAVSNAGSALDVLISTSANVNVVAGLATGTGTAQPAPLANANASLAAGTGTAQPAPLANAAARIAHGTGTAQPAPMIYLHAGLAAGTGAALAAAYTTAARPATGTGTAQPAPLANVSPGTAAGTGTARSASPGSVTSPVLTAYGFGSFPQVPPGAVITSVIAAVLQYSSDTETGIPGYELWDGTAARIGAAYGTVSTVPGHADTLVFTGVAYAQLATLQLRIYATSQAGNSGAAVNVDAVSLSVSWLPSQSAAVVPGVLAAGPAIRAVSASGIVNSAITPAQLAVVPAFPAVTAGFRAAAVFPGRLAASTAIRAPKAAASTVVTPGTLAAATALPGVTDVTVPGWASGESVGGLGSGSWVNPVNVTGSPDGSYATWTVP